MKIFLMLILLLASCSSDMSNAEIYDKGKKQIGYDTYIKCVYINSDRVYFLVDANDRLLGNSASTNVTINTQTGKSSSSTRVESSTIITK